jgi:hypothetical protein
MILVRMLNTALFSEICLNVSFLGHLGGTDVLVVVELCQKFQRAAYYSIPCSGETVFSIIFWLYLVWLAPLSSHIHFPPKE